MEVVDVKVVFCAGEEAVVDFAGVVEPSQECQHPHQACQQSYSQVTVTVIYVSTVSLISLSAAL